MDTDYAKITIKHFRPFEESGQIIVSNLLIQKMKK